MAPPSVCPQMTDMGNSEVGHNALGCGQVYSQGAKLVEESIESGKLFQSKTWQDLVSNCLTRDKALHFLGLLSDGNVHSNISHLFAMLKAAKTAGVHRVYCHILLDGRDVPATSALTYVDALEQVLAELREPGFDYAIASGGGRMQITMDRYQANWPWWKPGGEPTSRAWAGSSLLPRRPLKLTGRRQAALTRTCPPSWWPGTERP